MNKQNRAGQLDPAYGEDGQAWIPAEPPRDPHLQSLQVEAQQTDRDGAAVFCGYNSDDSSHEPMFIRLLDNGKWDSTLGHVKLEPIDAPDVPDGIFAFRSLVPVEIDNQLNYLTVSAATYINYSDDSYLEYVAVGRLDNAFKPVNGFGKGGLSYPHPGPPWEVLTKGAALDAYKKSIDTFALFYWNTRPVALSGGLIRVIFPKTVFREDDSSTTSTWLTLFNPTTGELALGLGDDRKESQLELTSKSHQPLELERAEFLSDGSFVLLARKESDRTVVLRRYFDNGLPDADFADGKGEITFDGTGNRHFGMDVKGDRIVVSSGHQYNDIQPTTVHCFTLTGVTDPDFNNGNPLQLGRGLKLNFVRIDTQQRIVLAGTQFLQPPLTALSVVRLNSDGSLDQTFGDNGFYDGAPNYWAANDLFVSGDEIRVLTLFPPKPEGAFHEVMIKLLD